MAIMSGKENLDFIKFTDNPVSSYGNVTHFSEMPACHICFRTLKKKKEGIYSFPDTPTRNRN